MLDIGRFMQDGIGSKNPQIKSIQFVEFATDPHGSTNKITNVTLANAVNPDCCIVFQIGTTARYAGSAGVITRLWVSSETTVSIRSTNGITQCGAIVIEFDQLSVKSKQSGITSVTNVVGGLNNVALSTINPAKSLCSCMLNRVANTSAYSTSAYVKSVSENNLVIVSMIGTVVECGWDVLELY